MSSEVLIPGYWLRYGSVIDRAALVRVVQRTYQELYPHEDFSHLATTVDQHFSKDTPLWWVQDQPAKSQPMTLPVGCLWLGNAIDQITGDRHAHILLLYVIPERRRQGIGTALVQRAAAWARARGDRQLGLQVFATNQPAINLYNGLGFQTQSFWMLKPL
ncbi:N-acetyltransferase [Leptolyngbya sp. 'hensonii']|uniref:GNAT family N-acetyltransferase n=1 Tax=Leptolyngbya sp. 'hensonii' TaxID=1922337 RepID=UPI000AA58ED6|nr:N-acetyltransferase [Leptolyngbya sp. 'hensonii']